MRISSHYIIIFKVQTVMVTMATAHLVVKALLEILLHFTQRNTYDHEASLEQKEMVLLLISPVLFTVLS